MPITAAKRQRPRAFGRGLLPWTQERASSVAEFLADRLHLDAVGEKGVDARRIEVLAALALQEVDAFVERPRVLVGTLADQSVEDVGEGIPEVYSGSHILDARTQEGEATGATRHETRRHLGRLDVSMLAGDEGVTLAAGARINTAGRAVAVAKARAGRTATTAVQEGVQMHGGMGMTDQFDIGFFMKRARVCEELFGDANFHADQLARAKSY